MGFKGGAVVGFGIGYVLGAKAGRERYEDIRRWWGQLSGTPAFRQATETARGIAGEGSRRGMYAVQRGVEKAGSAVRDRLHRNGDPTERVRGRVESQSGEPHDQSSPAADEAFGPRGS